MTTDAQRQIADATKMPALNRAFLAVWKMAGGPDLEQEYPFTPDRLYRADFCHVATKSIIELDGQVHAIESRRNDDAYRNNLATREGWKVYHVTAGIMQSDPYGIVTWLIHAIERAEKEQPHRDESPGTYET